MRSRRSSSLRNASIRALSLWVVVMSWGRTRRSSAILGFVLAVALGGLASAGSFVLDPPSPSWPDSNDILRDNPGPVSALPRLSTPAAALGLQAQDVIDALSDGRDPIDPERHQGSPRLIFSVTRGSAGAAGTDVAAEKAADTSPPAGALPNGHASDLFVWEGTYGVNQLAPAPLGWALGSQTGDEANGHLRLPGAGQPGDNVDAYDRGALVFLQPGGGDDNPGGGAMFPPFPIFFSLRAGSPTLAMIGATPGDVLAVGGPLGPNPVVFLSHAALGIPPQADLDALNLEVRQNAAGALVAHRIRFSIDRSTLGFALPGGGVVDSGAHVLTLQGGVPVIAVKADELGLLLEDDVDALESAFVQAGPQGGDGVMWDIKGGAVGLVSPSGNSIQVTEVSPEGEDGVVATFGPATRLAAEFVRGEPRPETRGARRMRIQPLGGVTEQDLALPFMDYTDDSCMFELVPGADTAALLPYIEQTAFRDGAQVLQERVAVDLGLLDTKPFARLITDGTSNTIFFGFAWRPGKAPGVVLLDVELRSPGGEDVFKLGGASGSADRVVVSFPYRVSIDLGPYNLYGVDTTANVDFRIRDMEVAQGVVQPGSTHRSRGQARVAGSLAGGVEVSNIGSTGEDGVDVEAAEASALSDPSLTVEDRLLPDAKLSISFNFDKMTVASRVDFALIGSPLGFYCEINGMAGGYLSSLVQGGGGGGSEGFQADLTGTASLLGLEAREGAITLVFDGPMSFDPADGSPVVLGTSITFLDVWEHALQPTSLEVRAANLESFRISSPGVSGGASFRRGDSNGSGRVDIADPLRTLNVLFLGDADLPCEDAADANDDGRIDLADAITTLNALFVGNATIPAPGMSACGADPTDDALGCGDAAACD